MCIRSSIQERFRPKSPNTTITIILTKPLTQRLQKSIQTALELEEFKDTTNYTPHGKFYRHTLQTWTKDTQEFKERVGKIQEKYPDIVIYSESMLCKKSTWRWLGPVLGGLGVLGKFIVDMWPF